MDDLKTDEPTPIRQYPKTRGIRTAAIMVASVPKHGDPRSDARWLGYLENAVRYCVIDLDSASYLAQLAGYEVDYEDGRWIGTASRPGDHNRSRRGHR